MYGESSKQTADTMPFLLSFLDEKDAYYFTQKTTVGLSPSMEIAKDGDLESLLECLEEDDCVGAVSEFGATLLHFAALNEHHGVEIVGYLVHHTGLDLRKTDADGEEAIFYSIRSANLEVAQVLLEMRGEQTKNLLHFVIQENKTDFAPLIHDWNPELIKEADSSRLNALHLAAEHSDVEFCLWLIDEGVDASSVSFFGTAMHRAPLNMLHGWKLVELFAALMLDVNEKAESGWTPLHAALSVENIKAAEMLLGLGANLMPSDENFLFFCVSNDKLESAKFVFGKKRSLILDRDRDTRTALHIAAEVADQEMCQWIIDRGVRVKSLCFKWHSSVLHHVGYNSEHGAQLVRFFKDLGLDLDQLDISGYTPLDYALRAKNFSTAAEMIRLGTRPFWFWQRNDLNILHTCIINNNLEAAQFMHSKNANLIKKKGKEGANALHLAALYGDLQMCEWLCKEDVDVLSLSDGGRNTVLHYAALNEKHGKSLIPFFVSKAVDVNKVNKYSLAPLHGALLKQLVDVAAELLKAGADISIKLKGDNVLHLCIRKNLLASVQFVVEAKAELLREDTVGGMTPMHLAALKADLDICKFLVQEGASILVVDNLGQSVLDFVPRDRKDKMAYFRQLGLRN